MNKAKDCIGKKFGRLTILKIDHIAENGQTYVLCKCECGTKKIINFGSISAGLIVSCGCRQREIQKYGSITHGKRYTRIYNIWCVMKTRCYCKKYREYQNYGGKGVIICEEWLNSFEAFYNWAMSHGYTDNLSIDRIDNNGNYEPSNCRWADRKTQSRNMSRNINITHNGETHILKDWAEILGIDYRKMWYRYKKGYPIEKVFYNGNLKKC